MLCQMCGQHPATTHIKTIVNGKLTQAHLCADCAKKQGYGNLLADWGSGFGSLLSGFMGSAAPARQVTRCPGCGASFEDITRSGKIGCAECYHTFRGRLLPIIQRIHGTAQHKGKVPGSSALRVTDTNNKIVAVEETPLEEKKRLLKQAIETQDFERAAVLRDEIKELEQHG